MEKMKNVLDLQKALITKFQKLEKVQAKQGILDLTPKVVKKSSSIEEEPEELEPATAATTADMTLETPTKTEEDNSQALQV